MAMAQHDVWVAQGHPSQHRKSQRHVAKSIGEGPYASVVTYCGISWLTFDAQQAAELQGKIGSPDQTYKTRSNAPSWERLSHCEACTG